MLGSLLLLATSMMTAPSIDDPLAPARRGLIRCSIPDTARKTCRTFGRYSLKSGDRYLVDVRGLTTNDGLVIEYRASGAVERGAICLTLTENIIGQAQFIKSGVTLTNAALAAARQRTIDFLYPLLGKKICSRDRRDGTGTRAEVSVDDARIPELDKPVRWISEGDGYTIAPPDGEAI
ncbi:hypothetical protein [Sphingomonas bacterium]|uniref:hypothetical protein n=1 Tax=Sphingomonas bacterium TaxID=1895847 RepID=UPI00262A8105|nr:hypothetical protein [Sphingomonas bacterium]MDB5677145.1 hypothetical protein [Sphingomonas bacterium]